MVHQYAQHLVLGHKKTWQHSAYTDTYACTSNNVTYIRNSHTYIHTYVTHIRNTCMYIQVHLHKHIHIHVTHKHSHTCTYTRTFYNPTTSKLRYSLSIQSHRSSHFEDESKWCAFKAVKLHHPGTSGKKQPTPELYINNGAKEVCYFQWQITPNTFPLLSFTSN